MTDHRHHQSFLALKCSMMLSKTQVRSRPPTPASPATACCVPQGAPCPFCVSGKQSRRSRSRPSTGARSWAGAKSALRRQPPGRKGLGLAGVLRAVALGDCLLPSRMCIGPLCSAASRDLSGPPWWGPEAPSSKGMAPMGRPLLNPRLLGPGEESPLSHGQQASAPMAVPRRPKCPLCWPGYRPIASELGHREHSSQLPQLPL